MINLSSNIIYSDQYIEPKGSEGRYYNSKPAGVIFKNECVALWLSGKFKKIADVANTKGVNCSTLKHWISEAKKGNKK